MVGAEYIHVSVAYVGEEGDFQRALEVRPGTALEEVITRSGLLDRFREIDLATNKVGIFGKLAKLDQAVEDGDRIEVYRPLIADPKEVRKRRASGDSR